MSDCNQASVNLMGDLEMVLSPGICFKRIADESRDFPGGGRFN